MVNSKFIILFSMLSFSRQACSSSELDNVDLKPDQKLPFQKVLPHSCRNVVSNQSRVIATLSSGLEVMCDTKTDGGGWTIFQRRINGSLSFFRGWEEYKYGFGDLAKGEFYLGNEHIHRITVQARHELRVDFKFHHASFFASFARFSLYGEGEGYRLKINMFSGNAGDSLSRHHNIKFSTYDRGSDSAGMWCANTYKGAWWYIGCHSSNLNGIWGSTEHGIGMNWYTITGHYLSATFTEMKFREIK